MEHWNKTKLDQVYLFPTFQEFSIQKCNVSDIHIVETSGATGCTLKDFLKNIVCVSDCCSGWRGIDVDIDVEVEDMDHPLEEDQEVT